MTITRLGRRAEVRTVKPNPAVSWTLRYPYLVTLFSGDIGLGTWHEATPEAVWARVDRFIGKEGDGTR